jgi:hypothetical protein
VVLLHTESLMALFIRINKVKLMRISMRFEFYSKHPRELMQLQGERNRDFTMSINT